MFSALLHTKFQRPILGNTVIPRPHLLRRLDERLTGKVTLVSAPAGFGKSTFVSGWIDHLANSSAQTTNPFKHISWLSLDAEDNQLPTFVMYLVGAIEQSVPHSCAEVIEILQQNPAPTIETLADLLLNRLNQLADPLVLVLDDLHVISDAAIYAFLIRLIEYAPRQVHLVLISRVDPPMPLHRWRARGHLNEFRLHDLSFTLAETIEFLARNLDNAPPGTLIQTLHKRTEGWAVGIWLALLALRGRTDYDEFAFQFEGATRRYIVDYLVDEVLHQQPEPVQKFLIHTAILDRFCVGLCAAITETDETSAQQHLDHVAHTNLFLIELSSPPFWYRYHHQFQDMLLSRLQMRQDREAIATLHRRAADWLAAHNQIAEALHHLVAIPDLIAAADLIEDRRVATLNELRFYDLEGWLNHLPTHLLSQRPGLLISLAWVQHDRVDHDGCLATVQRAKALLKAESATLPEGNEQILNAELVAIETSLNDAADREASLALIRQSWWQIRNNLAQSHCHAILALAYTSQELGDLELAMTIVRTTLAETTEWPLTARCRVLHTVGFFHFCNGDLAEAELKFQQNLRLAQQHNLPVISIISRHGLGAIADVRNQPEQAEEHHLEVVNNPYLTSGRDAVVDMNGLIGIYARSGHPEKSRALVVQLRENAQVMDKPFFIEQVTALEAYVNLTCGEIKAAMRWALSTSHREMEHSADRIPIIRARILLADGSEACLLEADQILQGLIEYYNANYVWHRQTEAFVLQALTRSGLGQSDSALAALAKAVQIAVPKGGVGLFVGHDGTIRRLLYKLKTHPECGRLVALLLASSALDDVIPERMIPVQDLPEALTERELDVLKLLAERHSNKEVARLLVISPHTVRNHTVNIYGKLQVENRREAVERAQVLGLLLP